VVVPREGADVARLPMFRKTDIYPHMLFNARWRQRLLRLLLLLAARSF
jgi:hypothetical protein